MESRPHVHVATYRAGGAPLASYDWVGFDLDHALARYRVPAVAGLVHERLVAAVAELHGVPTDALAGSYTPAAMVKGLLLDFTTGDAVKLDQAGRVAAASHGGHALPPDARRARYGDGAWWGLAQLRAQARHPGFFVLLTYFDAPCVALAARLVALADAGALPGAEPLPPPPARPGDGAESPRYARVRAMLTAAFDHIFDNVKGWDGRGGFFTALRTAPELFVLPRPRLRAWLLTRRARGGRTFLATNSQQRFADLLLGATLGPGWQACFDAVCYACMKPAFFAKIQPFHAVDDATGTEGEPLAVLPGPPLHAGGGGAEAPAPAPLRAIQGHAGAIQALADADCLLLRRCRQEGAGAARGGEAHLHVDARGHVLHATRGADALGERVPVVVRHVKPRVSASTAAWMAHGTPPPDASGADDDGEAALPTQAQAAREAEEPPQALSLTDALAHRVDPASGVELEGGGAEARHPGHARVLYVGDHLHGDVSAAAVECEWDVVAVVEELEAWACPVAAAEPAGAREGAAAALSVVALPRRAWHAPANLAPAVAAAGQYGGFFAGCACPAGSSCWGAALVGSPVAAANAAATGAAAVATAPCSHSGPSYFAALLARHASLAVSDVEAWLDADAEGGEGGVA